MADNIPKDAALQSTKQMLDELDALMERMLSLPVSELEQELENPPAASKGPSLTASLTLLSPDDAPPDHADEPRESTSARPASTPPPAKRLLDRRPRPSPHPSMQPPHLRKTAAPTASPMAAPPPVPPPPEPLTNEIMPASILPNLDPRLTQAPAQGLSFNAVAVVTVPVWRMNQTYDRITKPLGKFGYWLHGPGARGLLGLTGIGLIFVAVGWVLRDLLGWN